MDNYSTSTSPNITQLVLNIEDTSILPSLKKVLGALNGVSIARRITKPKVQASELNATTIKAIEDVRAGKTYKASSVDELLAQCLG